MVVEDQRMFLQLLVAMLRTQPDLDVVATAGTAADGIAACSTFRPDLLILDLVLPDADGLCVAQALRVIQPSARVIILSSHAPSFLRPLELRSMIHAVVDKTRAYEELLEEIATLTGAGRRHQQQLPHAENLRALTTRERHVLRLIGKGLDNRDIATELAISVRTVETHRSRIVDKLGIQGKAELVRQAMLYLQLANEDLLLDAGV
ncbi:MAG: response regulator transcription factor [Cyanobacteriota bacterium]|nr:response regulator transcription factor [Cyanobacteriota bacterium]